MEQENTARQMNRQDVQTEWEKPSDNPLDGMTNDDVRALLQYRTELTEGILDKYKDFVEAIFRLPIHVVYRQNAFQNIDQGLHWVEKAISNIWKVPPPKAEPVPEIDGA